MHLNTTTLTKKGHSGFTIVELLIVVIVIAILATITIVGYTGIASQAMDAKIKTTLSAVGKSLQIEELKGVQPSSVGYWTNTNGVDSIVVPKYFAAGYRDDHTSPNVNANSRIFRYYRCGNGFVLYASLNRPTSSEIQSFQNIRTQCGQTTSQAPDTPPLVYNYAQMYN